MKAGIRTAFLHMKRTPQAVYKEFTDDVYAAMDKLWVDALRVFLEEVALSGIVHVDTGMSRASLIPLAKNVRGYAAAIRASISRDMKHLTQKKRKKHVWGGWRSIAHGIQIGEESFSFQLSDGDSQEWRFSFRINVYQYYVNESGLDGGSPWNSLTRGRDAMREYLIAELPKRVPQLSGYLQRWTRLPTSPATED